MKKTIALAAGALLAFGMAFSQAASGPARYLSWISTDSPYGSPTVELARDGYVLYLDPTYIPDGKKLDKADYILITHAHPDHFDMAAIAELAKPTAVIVAPGDIAWKLEDAGYAKVVTLAPKGTWKDKRIALEALPMDTGGDDTAHPRSMEWIGYVLTAGKDRYYFSGDSGLLADVQGLKNVDVAVLNLRKEYMTGSEGVLAWAAKVKPKQLALVHTLAEMDGEEIGKVKAGLPKSVAYFELPIK